jgi:hypothetical protein
MQFNIFIYFSVFHLFPLYWELGLGFWVLGFGFWETLSHFFLSRLSYPSTPLTACVKMQEGVVISTVSGSSRRNGEISLTKINNLRDLSARSR